MNDRRVEIIAKGLAVLGLSGKPDIRYHSGSLFEMYKVVLPGHPPLAAKVMDSEYMAQTEMEGLVALGNTGCPVPQTHGVFYEDRYAVLYMEFIEATATAGRGGEILENLSLLAAAKNEKWGWEKDNFIGSLPQKNGFYDSFREFYWEARFLPQLNLAKRKQQLGDKHFERTKKLLHHFTDKWELESFTPRLVHGDLWNGNVLGSAGKVFFIDPSVAWSHPEQDLGMLQLFGSAVSAKDMETFATGLGMQKGLEERIPFWQIYPVLVHVNLFGSSYTSSFERILKNYGF